MATSPIPVTIITGFLGAGKTTLILHLIPQLPPTYRIALLKNEFGDVAVDSQLASASSISGVREILNGCICCNLVGQLSDALLELRTSVNPDRVIIETSGSAFPATLAMEVNRIGRETGAFALDGVVSVIDVENWKGYEETSVTAKLQARYTDLIVLNKWEGVGERRIEDVEDRIGDLEVDTPKEKSDRGWVSRDVLLGIDAKLAGLGVEKGGAEEHGHEHGHGEHHNEVEVLSITLSGSSEDAVDIGRLVKLLEDAPREEVYRIKGILKCKVHPVSSDDDRNKPPPAHPLPKEYILNWAFGRWTFTAIGPAPEANTNGVDIDLVLRLTVVTAREESSKWKKRIEAEKFIILEGEGSPGSLTITTIS
ncbi:CobW domain protein [Eremomyces bilateralis CBS 781.70]|uniref:CobW domain protein n=1 Tax=Eremomyces bilateralis CBS 781.70 TaxID=1392243 RepID=A0A6G1GD75_9PEZI|nr:CobW domain protein [Eremomyces bilateralis CBS 781.70]KAF1815819.1 CobW domain protein [Eremomyces bilateralis CBS 781.70]